jgi:hypothetical protein
MRVRAVAIAAANAGRSTIGRFLLAQIIQSEVIVDAPNKVTNMNRSDFEATKAVGSSR